MTLEDKKLYFKSTMFGEVIINILFLVITLGLYVFAKAETVLLYLSGFLALLTIFSVLNVVRNLKHRIFAESTFYTSFNSKHFELLGMLVLYSYGTWYLYDYSYNNQNYPFIMSIFFGLFLLGCLEALFGILKNLKRYITTFNTKPTVLWYSDNQLNTKFSENAIYIVTYTSVPTILHAYENYFTVPIQNSKSYLDYDDEGINHIYYKGKKIRPSILEAYMNENNKTFATMTDNDITLLQMQQI